MEDDDGKFVRLYDAITNGATTYDQIAAALGENKESVRELYSSKNKESRERVQAVKNIYERKRRQDLTKKYEEAQNSYNQAKGDTLEGDIPVQSFSTFFEKHRNDRDTFPSFSVFYERYMSLTKEHSKCFYCGIEQTTIVELFDIHQIHTKRSTTRGNVLELERKSPSESYSNLDNLTLACYWCNNAKSDEFSMQEFQPIAEQIGKALKARLSKS